MRTLSEPAIASRTSRASARRWRPIRLVAVSLLVVAGCAPDSGVVTPPTTVPVEWSPSFAEVGDPGYSGCRSASTSANVVYGTPGNDVLNGTAGADKICGYGGNDTISGLGGDDTIYGGSGNDTIYGGDNDDRIHPWLGDDTVYAGAGDDLIAPTAGSDLVYAEAGNDLVTGNGFFPMMAGASNVVFLGDGDDSFTANGSGASADVGPMSVYGGAGWDTINGGAADDYLTLGPEGPGPQCQTCLTENVYGNNGNDILVGTSVSNSLIGGNGDDILRDVDGPHGLTYDLLRGGYGADRVFSFDGFDDTVDLEPDPTPEFPFGLPIGFCNVTGTIPIGAPSPLPRSWEVECPIGGPFVGTVDSSGIVGFNFAAVGYPGGSAEIDLRNLRLTPPGQKEMCICDPEVFLSLAPGVTYKVSGDTFI